MTAYDTATPCAQPGALGGLCGATPTHLYAGGAACRYDAPGATDQACQHGTPWADHCSRCDGAPPAPSQRPSPSATRTPPTYGMATSDPLGRTITRGESGKPYDDRLPRYQCPGCGRPRAKGHQGEHA